ncbi:hypothetical protein BGX26_009540 [Mortierella sp. AD094]|nr:hypothetical protein BGX26_009540 [Mortierella sp. AD094]
MSTSLSKLRKSELKVREESPRAGVRRSTESSRLANLSSAYEDRDTSGSGTPARSLRSSPKRKTVPTSRSSTATRTGSDSDSAEDPLSEHQVRNFIENVKTELHDVTEKVQFGTERIRRSSADFGSSLSNVIGGVVSGKEPRRGSRQGDSDVDGDEDSHHRRHGHRHHGHSGVEGMGWCDRCLVLHDATMAEASGIGFYKHRFRLDHTRAGSDDRHVITGILSRTTTSGLSYFVFKFAVTYLLGHYAHLQHHHDISNTSRLAEFAKGAAETVGFGGNAHSHAHGC